MRIWLIKIGEPLPTDPGSPRLLRTGLLAAELATRGHEVVYWTSALDLRSKKNRVSSSTWQTVTENYRLRLAVAPEFQNSFSVARVRHNSMLNRSLREDLKQADKPDLIFCSYPTIDTALTAVTFAQKHQIPSVIDVRDLWPDAIAMRTSGLKRKLITPMLARWERIASKALSGASAVTGITPEILTWAQSKGRGSMAQDRAFYFGYPEPMLSEAELQTAQSVLASKGIHPDPSKLTICYLGTLTSAVAFETVAKAMEQLNDQKSPVRLILCGAGDHEAQFRERASHLPNVIFGGWLGKAEVWSLMKMSQVGLLPYVSTFDFEASIPNKIPEYLAAGLPILSSVAKGVPFDLLKTEQVGQSYTISDSSTLTKIIQSLLAAPEQLQAMSRRARALFEAQFRAEVVYAEFANFLEDLVNSGSQGAQ